LAYYHLGKKCLSANLKEFSARQTMYFWKAKYYLDFFKDLSVQNNYHHLYKGNNSFKQL
jgi:hypothetical protein